MNFIAFPIWLLLPLTISMYSTETPKILSNDPSFYQLVIFSSLIKYLVIIIVKLVMVNKLGKVATLKLRYFENSNK